jgi:hypothetical protein
MKKNISLLMLCAVVMAACGVKTERGGPVYYAAPDFYRMSSGGTLTLLEGFKTFQQTTGVTCGPCCALMALDYFGRLGDYGEMDLKALRGTNQDTTYLRHLIAIIDAVGGFDRTSTFDYASHKDIPKSIFLDFLKKGVPVIIGTNEWEGHWQVVIGYDTMGSETTEDDVIILADPYDHTDHVADGYAVGSFEKLYYGSWKNSYDPDYDRGLFLAVWPAD